MTTERVQTPGPATADELPAFRRLPIPEALAWLAEHGEPADPRPDIDTASLQRRFPHLAAVTQQSVEVDGPAGAVPTRLYVDPTAAASGRAFIWIHGGGFIGGSLDMPEANWTAMEIASRGIPVISVDYRKCLGGVHYPAPADDVYAAWGTVRAQLEDLTGVGPNALVLGGASAGAVLAAGLIERLAAAGEPGPARAVLVYPPLHPNAPEASAEIDEASPHGQLSLNYAGSVEALRDAQAFAGMGTGEHFPPTLVLVCERDVLRPSGEAFAELLAAAGREVQLYLERDAEHGHLDKPGRQDALHSIAAIVDWIRATG